MQAKTSNQTFSSSSDRLCFLQYEGYHLNNKQAYKAMVREPNHVCQSCGRTANQSKRLCEPASL